MHSTYQIDAAWTHAGGVVYRRRSSTVEVLLVRARPTPHDWVLPKGHIEPGELPHECARREIREEAGVEAEPVAFIGTDQYTSGEGKVVNAAFFLMEFVADAIAQEDRDTLWCPFGEATMQVRFDGARDILLVAARRLDDGVSGR